MQYDGYSIKDFALDDHFINWVLNPNPEVNAYWEHWLKQHPEKKETLEEARRIILLARFREDRPSHQDVRQVWNRIEQAWEGDGTDRIAPDIIRPLRSQPSQPKQSLFTWSRVAAAMALLVIFSVTFYKLIPLQNVLSFNIEERENPRGQQSTLMLPDGTQVWLNAASTLSFPKSFKGKPTREVELKGEAFFEVVKNKQQPFIVHTGTISVRVLGTRFNVKSYGEDELIETTLVEGKVEVNNAQWSGAQPATVTLLPNQKAVFSKKTAAITTTEVEPALYTAWKEGKLIFKNTPVSEVLQTINRKFDVNIQPANKQLNRCTVTADFTNQSLTKALEVMCKLIEASYEQKGKEIILKGKGCD
jgi:ferric-dicitrate binding protein FerR (iron transport regulator)